LVREGIAVEFQFDGERGKMVIEKFSDKGVTFFDLNVRDTFVCNGILYSKIGETEAFMYDGCVRSFLNEDENVIPVDIVKIIYKEG